MGVNTLLTRAGLARLIAGNMLPTWRRTMAEAWAHGVGRIEAAAEPSLQVTLSVRCTAAA